MILTKFRQRATAARGALVIPPEANPPSEEKSKVIKFVKYQTSLNPRSKFCSANDVRLLFSRLPPSQNAV